jgi:hypothetical protein
MRTELAFPYRDYFPAHAFEVESFSIIAFYVSIEFGFPEFSIVLWKAVIAARTSMPEATVEENGNLFRNE